MDTKGRDRVIHLQHQIKNIDYVIPFWSGIFDAAFTFYWCNDHGWSRIIETLFSNYQCIFDVLVDAAFIFYWCSDLGWPWIIETLFSNYCCIFDLLVPRRTNTQNWKLGFLLDSCASIKSGRAAIKSGRAAIKRKSVFFLLVCGVCNRKLPPKFAMHTMARETNGWLCIKSPSNNPSKNPKGFRQYSTVVWGQWLATRGAQNNDYINKRKFVHQ